MSTPTSAREIETLVKKMVFTEDKQLQQQVREMAQANGIFPASIQSFYEAIGKGRYTGFSVPAMNIRGIAFDTARDGFLTVRCNLATLNRPLTDDEGGVSTAQVTVKILAKTGGGTSVPGFETLFALSAMGAVCAVLARLRRK